MSKGTIIYLGGFEMPDKNAAAHRVLSNGKILRNLGYQVVFVGVDKSLSFETCVVSTYSTVQGFDSWSIPYPSSTLQWLRYISSIKEFLLVSAKYPDLKAVICYNYQAIALRKLISFCRRKGIKIIADCTEWYGAQGKNPLLKAAKGLDSFFRMRILHKQADGLIVISKYLADFYKCKKIVVIPPLVDISEEKWRSIGSEKPVSELRLVYSGSPGVNKDKLNSVIRSLHSLKDIRACMLVIIGISAEDYLSLYPEDKEIIHEMSARLKFMGRLAHQDSLQQVRLADYTIFVRENNRVCRAGFPTKFCESISCGVPVITNATSDVADYLRTGKNGLLVDSDLTKSLKEILLSSDEELKVLRSQVNCAQFDFRNYVDKFAEFFNMFY